MAKYIEVEPLIKGGWQLQRYNSGDGYVNQEHASLKDIPPADVRPVVLCGVCRWFIDTGYPEIGSDIPKLRTGHCRVLCRDVHACWFCGAGEQKEDAVGNEKD